MTRRWRESARPSAVLALLPLVDAVGGLASRPTAGAIWLLAGLGTGPIALAYTLYYRGRRSASPSTAALLTLLESIVAALLGAAVLGAPGTVVAVLLAVAVISAVRLDGRLTGVTATSG
jgi:DME family drug/metabolite transporter